MLAVLSDKMQVVADWLSSACPALPAAPCPSLPAWPRAPRALRSAFDLYLAVAFYPLLGAASAAWPVLCALLLRRCQRTNKAAPRTTMLLTIASTIAPVIARHLRAASGSCIGARPPAPALAATAQAAATAATAATPGAT